MTTGASNYGSRSWSGDNGMDWKANDARTDQTITEGNPAICIRQTNGKITGLLNSNQQSTGIGSITFTAKNTAAVADNAKATTYVIKCGSIQKTVTVPAMGKNTATVTVPDINAVGTDAETIEITISKSAGVRVTIDDIVWTAAQSAGLDLQLPPSSQASPISKTTAPPRNKAFP